MSDATGSVKIRVNADTKELQKMQKQLNECEEEIRRLNAESKSSNGAAAKAAEKTAQATDLTNRMLKKQNSTMTTTQAQYNALLRKAQRLREEMEKTGKVKAPTAEYAALKDELEQTQAEMQRLEESKHGIEEGAYAKKTNAQLAEMRTRCAEITDEMQRMEKAGTDMTESFADPAKYQKLQDELAKTNDQIAATENRMNGAGSSTKDFAKAAGTFVRSSKSASGALRSMNGALNTTAGTIGLAAGIAVMAINAVVSGAKECLETGTELMKSIISGAAKIAKAVKQKIADVLPGIEDLAEAAGEAVSGFADSVKSAAESFISTGLNELMEAFNDQLDLAQEAGILAGDSMNQLEDDLADIGNALVSAFTPIIEIVIPYINLMAEALANVINMLGMFFASLAGKTSYTKLVKITDELEDAADASEEAENNLAAFDELDVLSEETTGTSSDSGISYELEEVELDQWSAGLEGLLDELDEWLSELDGFEIGYDLAQTIADWLNGINWDEIQETAGLIGETLADILNGIFANLELAEAIGTTVAEALNTALAFAYNFLTNFDFYQFGEWIGTAINAAVETFEWDTLGETIAAGINGIFSAVRGFIETTDWYELFYGIGTTIYTAITEIDWVNIAETILAGINGITEALWGFIDSIDWVDMAAEIVAGIWTLAEGQYIDEDGQLHDIWSENGEAVGTFINEFVDGVLYTVQNLPYEEIGTAICDWLGSALGAINWENVGTAIYTFVEGLITTISTMINDEETKQEIITALSDLISGLNAAELVSDITDLVYELFDYLYDVLEESGALEELGELAMNLMGLGFAVKFNTFALKVVTLWEGLSSQVSEAWNNLWGSIGTGLEESKNSVLEQMEAIRSGIYDKLSGISVFWAEIFDGFFECVETVWTNMRDTIDGAIMGIQTVIETVLNVIAGNWEEAWNGLTSIVKGVVNTLIGIINTLISSVETMINSVISALNSLSFDLPEVLGGGHVGFSIDEVSLPRVPTLANGAVISGGNPYLAVLGDQNAGQTNIETPLETMVEAFETALENSGYNNGINSVTLELDGKKLASASLDYYTSELNRRGTSVSTALGVS